MSETTMSVSVEQVAAVLAAEQEGFSLDEVLAIEGIDGADWRNARAEVLLKVSGDPDEHERYAKALSAAQDRLHCAVDPLFDDVAAWVAFVKETDDKPFMVLADAYALVPNDLSRLERHWRERFGASPELRNRAQLLRENPPALPPLSVGERTLTPSPYAHRAPADEGAENASLEGGANEGDAAYDELHRMAALYAVLRSNVTLNAAHADFGFAGVVEARAAIAAWDVRLKENTQLGKDFRALLSHYRRRRELQRTRAPMPAPHRQVAHHACPVVPTQTTHQSLDETAMLGPDHIALDALPFADASSAPDSVDTTAFLTALVFDGPVHPFEVPGDGARTASAVDIDATSAVIPALRFSAPTPFENDAAARDAGPAPTRVAFDADALDETGIIDAIRFDALPFGSEDAAPLQAAGTKLTLEQYASYCAELAMFPEQTARIRARYHIAHEHEHKELALEWDAAMTASESMGARFHEVYAAYRGHLREHPLHWEE